MIFTAWIDPFSLALGALAGATPCLYWASSKLDARKGLVSTQEQEVEVIKDDLYSEMVAYADEREHIAELTGHLRYKVEETNEKIKEIMKTEECLRVKERQLLEQATLLQKKEVEIQAQLKKKDEELKGARGRANRFKPR